MVVAVSRSIQLQIVVLKASSDFLAFDERGLGSRAESVILILGISETLWGMSGERLLRCPENLS